MKRYPAFLFSLLGVFGVTFADGQEALQHSIPGWLAPLLWSAGQAEVATDVAKAPSGLGREGLQALPTSPLPLIGITPCRIADTRDGGRPPGYGPPTLPASVARNFTLTGQCGIAATAGAVSLNITVTNTAGPGFISIYPQGGTAPLVSTLNYVAGQTVANAAVVPLGTGGGITVVAGVSGTDLILDTNGYYDDSGVITGITAGTGLTGGGTSGNVSLGIANGGVGTAQLSAMGSSNGQALVSNGSAVNWGSPTSFTGTLSGEVTGTQGATVVSNAVSTNTANAIVRRDGSGGFSAGGVTLSGNLNLPTSNAAGTAGFVTLNGLLFLHAFGTNNTFAGTSAGNRTMTGDSNAALGFAALFGNTTGFANSAFGANALSNNMDGHENAAFGEGALFTNGAGNFNSAVGTGALHGNTSGSTNSAVGYFALFNNTTGSGNTAIGFGALGTNVGGIENTAVGIDTLFGNSNGSSNTAVGRSALMKNTNSSNTAVGDQALANDTSGSGNIAVGFSAGGSLLTDSNNIDIGNPGVAGDSGVIRIGSSGTHIETHIAGISGATSSSGVLVFVNSSGQLGTNTSSRRFKRDIEDMGGASEKIFKLRPVTFRYKSEHDASGLAQYGLVAEEVVEVDPDLVVYDEDGQPETVRYHFLVPMLLNEIQKDRKTITDLMARLERLETLMSIRSSSRQPF